MKNRLEFETIFPIPEGVEWEEYCGMYTAAFDYEAYEAYAYNYMFEAWKRSPISEAVEKIKALERHYSNIGLVADFRDKEYFYALESGLKIARKIILGLDDKSSLADYDKVYGEVD